MIKAKTHYPTLNEAFPDGEYPIEILRCRPRPNNMKVVTHLDSTSNLGDHLRKILLHSTYTNGCQIGGEIVLANVERVE